MAKEDPKQPKPDLNVAWQLAIAFTHLLDRNDRIANIGREHEITCRVMKIGEEAGEAMSARLIQLAQNPGKGKGSQRDVLDELADCISASLVAMYSMTGDVELCTQVIQEKMDSAVKKKRAKLDELFQKRNRMLYGEGK